MDITPLLPKGLKSITGYGGGGFKINHEFVTVSLLVLATEAQTWDMVEGQHITQELLSGVIDKDIELLLIGTGKQLFPLAADVRVWLKSHGIAADVMDTGAACRTYNVLLLEERKVAAAVIAI